MPELPDVEVYRRYIDATSLHQTIEDVEVDDDKILDRVEKGELRRALQSRSFENSRRHGKNMFISLGDELWLRLHFGMTGDLKYYRADGDAPDHTRVLFRFDSGYHLAYICQRLLGAVSLTEDVDRWIADEELGPDALDLDRDTFKELFRNRRGSLKTALMNQNVMAGIGNVYSDEILFQARLRPEAKVKALNDSDLDMLFDVMREVLTTAIDRRAQPEDFPSSYITGRREEGAECPRCSGTLEKKKVSQRSAYYCPQCARDHGAEA